MQCSSCAVAHPIATNVSASHQHAVCMCLFLLDSGAATYTLQLVGLVGFVLQSQSCTNPAPHLFFCAHVVFPLSLTSFPVDFQGVLDETSSDEGFDCLSCGQAAGVDKILPDMQKREEVRAFLASKQPKIAAAAPPANPSMYPNQGQGAMQQQQPQAQGFDAGNTGAPVSQPPPGASPAMAALWQGLPADLQPLLTMLVTMTAQANSNPSVYALNGFLNNAWCSLHVCSHRNCNYCHKPGHMKSGCPMLLVRITSDLVLAAD